VARAGGRRFDGLGGAVEVGHVSDGLGAQFNIGIQPPCRGTAVLPTARWRAPQRAALGDAASALAAAGRLVVSIVVVRVRTTLDVRFALRGIVE
jgi:hypothetical protein